MDHGFFMAGFILGIIIVAIINTIIGNRMKNKGNIYDERMLKNQLTGYKRGFYTALGLMIAIANLYECTSLDKHIAPSLMLIIIFMISVIVSTGYKIKTDAFFGIGQNAMKSIIFLICVTAINLIFGIMNIINGSLFEKGKLTLVSGANLVLGICLFIILIEFIAKKASMGKESDEES